MYYLAPIPKQFVDSSGVPLSDGTVEVYIAGYSQLAKVYLDAAGESLSPNPVRLDSHGSWIGYVSSLVGYDYIVKDKDGNVIFSYENVVIAGGDGPLPVADDDLWGHWAGEGGGQSEWTTVSNSWATIGGLVHKEGNIGSEQSSGVSSIPLKAGLYHYDLEFTFQDSTFNGYVKYDLEVRYGDQALRRQSFSFYNNFGSGKLEMEYAGGVFKMEEDGNIEFKVIQVDGTMNSRYLKIGNLFLHEISKLVAGGGGSGSYEAGEGIKIENNKIGLDYLQVDNQGRVCISYEEEE